MAKNCKSTPDRVGYLIGRNISCRKSMGKASPEMTIRHDRNIEELQRLIGNASGIIKLYMSCCNNATILVMRNAMESIKTHPSYTKKFSKVKGYYKQAFNAWKEYERNLLYARVNRFFHLEDMPEGTRKKYGNISDSEYYDYWCGIGASAYELSKNELNALKYKYERSLREHGVPYYKILAEAMLAMACLQLSCTMYEEQIVKAAEEVELPTWQLENIFNGFCLKKVADAWLKAMTAMDVEHLEYDLNDAEAKNIDLGLFQLAKKWTESQTLFYCSKDATQRYDEVFRTPGEQDKALRLLEETKAFLCS